MAGFALFCIAAATYACVRFGCMCVYADNTDKVHPGWSVFDNLILFAVAFGSILIVLSLPK